MSRRFWLIVGSVLGATLLYHNRSSLKQIRTNVRDFDLPTAGMYDALVAASLSGFYIRVADEIVAACPSETCSKLAAGQVGLPCVWLVPLQT